MRALVTGGTGFIGRHLVKGLLDKGWEVVCVTRRKLTSLTPAITCINGDLSSPQTLRISKDDVGTIDVVFHLAALMPGATNIKSRDYLKANILGTSELLESFLNLGASTFVYMSSLPVIGKPHYLPITEEHPTKPDNSYSVSKLAAELLCEQYRMSKGCQIVSLRLTSPYGPMMQESSVLPQFVKAAQTSKDIYIFGSGARTQNFIHINDVVRACLMAANTKMSGVFNLGGPSSISMKELGELIKKNTKNCKSSIVNHVKKDPQEDYRWEVDISLIHEAVGFVPQISIEEGLRGYIAFHSSPQTTLNNWWTPL